MAVTLMYSINKVLHRLVFGHRRLYFAYAQHTHAFLNLIFILQLHVASANGYSKVVEYLLENHAAVDAVDKDLWTPAHAAACWGHVCQNAFAIRNFHSILFHFI